MNVKALGVLKALGYSDNEIARRWGYTQAAVSKARRKAGYAPRRKGWAMEDRAREMRQLREEGGMTYAEIAAWYGVSRTTVSRLLGGSER